MPLILALMFLTLLLVTIGLVKTYNLGPHLALACVAALVLVAALKAGNRLLAAAAFVVGGAAVLIAVGTVNEGEDREARSQALKTALKVIQNVSESAGAEMGRRYPLKSFGQSSPDYLEYIDRVDAKIRSSMYFAEGQKGMLVGHLCRFAIANELGLLYPNTGQFASISGIPFDSNAWIDLSMLDMFTKTNTAPRHPETVKRCASLYGFKVPG